MLRKKEIIDVFRILGLSSEKDRKRASSIGNIDIAKTPEQLDEEAIASEQIKIVADKVTSGRTDEGEENARLERSFG